MYLDRLIIGKYTVLRSVMKDDAEFILSLRLDDKLNRYINKVENSIEKQREWIEKQQQRENDYYFIIQNTDQNPVGTISLYNIEGNRAEFGRWVSKGSVINNIESVLLLHKFGFEDLMLSEIYTNTVADNKSVLNFHKRFGARLAEKSHYDEVSGFTFIRGSILSGDFTEIETKNYKMLEMLE